MPINISTLRKRLFNQFPLLEFVINQKDVLVVSRPVDMRWHYQGVVPMSVSGFNPLRDRIFYGQHSYFQMLLEGDRPLTENDINWILYEAFFILHDYMHIWAISRLLELFPKCLSPDSLDSEDTVADLAFILLLSEAVATVSIDWWLLSKVDLSTTLKCKTTFRCLTTSFKMTDLSRAKRLNKKFQTDEPYFFEWLASAYLTGRFSGFDNYDFSAIKTFAPWLEKELNYGERQRDFVTQWVGHLSQMLSLESTACFYLNDPRRETIRWMGHELWSLFGMQSPSELSILKKLVPLSSTISNPNFEFNDLAHVQPLVDTLDLKALSDRQFGFLAAQWISYTPWSPKLQIGAARFDEIIRNRDLKSLRGACGEALPTSATTTNPCAHLFLPN